MPGGKFIVSPNVNTAVGMAAVSKGLDWCPGVITPSEALVALDQGAGVLVFFPEELIPPNFISAEREVLSKDALVAVVGGITPERMRDYRSAGTDGFGLVGSARFKPSYTLDDIGRRAAAFVSAAAALKAAA